MKYGSQVSNFKTCFHVQSLCHGLISALCYFCPVICCSSDKSSSRVYFLSATSRQAVWRNERLTALTGCDCLPQLDFASIIIADYLKYMTYSNALKLLKRETKSCFMLSSLTSDCSIFPWIFLYLITKAVCLLVCGWRFNRLKAEFHAVKNTQETVSFAKSNWSSNWILNRDQHKAGDGWTRIKSELRRSKRGRKAIEKWIIFMVFISRSFSCFRWSNDESIVWISLNLAVLYYNIYVLKKIRRGES